MTKTATFVFVCTTIRHLTYMCISRLILLVLLARFRTRRTLNPNGPFLLFRRQSVRRYRRRKSSIISHQRGVVSPFHDRPEIENAA